MIEKQIAKTEDHTNLASRTGNVAERIVQEQGSRDSLKILRTADKNKSDSGLPNVSLTVEAQSGDTLSGIVSQNLKHEKGESAAHYRNRLYDRVGDVAKANAIRDINHISAGQKIELRLPTDSASQKMGDRNAVGEAQGRQPPDRRRVDARQQTHEVPGTGPALQRTPGINRGEQPNDFSSKALKVGEPAKGNNDHAAPISPKGSGGADLHGGTAPKENFNSNDNTAQKSSAFEGRPEAKSAVPGQVAPLNGREFADASEAVLKKIHPDGLPATKGDLAKALQDPSIKGKDAEALAAMYGNFDKLSALNSSTGFFGSKSINKEALEKYADAYKTQTDNVKNAYDTKFWADNNFAKYADSSGQLSESQIKKALADPKTPADDKSQLEKIEKMMPDYGHGWIGFEKHMSKDDLAAEVKHVSGETPEAHLVNNVQGSLTLAYDGEMTAKDAPLYRTQNPLDSIKPDAIKQGSIGDCYFEAPLAAVASSSPQTIRDAIHDNKNGTYTVTFPGAKNEPITVKAPTEAEMSLYNRGGADGNWAAVMEKAFGQYKDNHNWVGSYTPQDAADGGGFSGSSLRLLTGKSDSDSSTLFNSQGALATKLEQAFSGPHLEAVTASTSKNLMNLISDDPQYTSGHYVRDHVFTITGFKPDGHGGGMVQMRNPWGLGAGPSGKFEIPLDQFTKNFEDIDMAPTH